MIEGQVAYTFSSDANLKEKFRAVDGETTLNKISQMNVGSWNYKGNDPQQFRHYGPTAPRPRNSSLPSAMTASAP